MVVRPGVPGDADAIAAVHGRAWWHAYEDVLPYDLLTRDDQDDRRATWTGLLAEDEPGTVLVVTTAEETICAVAAWGPSRDADRPADGELWALYVDPAAQGAGVGRLLHDRAVAALRDAGFPQVIVWVFEHDGHGRAFAAGRG